MSLLEYAVFNALLVAAAISDVRTFRIPNALTVSLALAGAVLAVPSLGEDGLLRLWSLLAVGGVGLGLYLARVLGGGDFKLLMAAALWIPLPDLPSFAILLALAGGAQGLATLATALALRGPTAAVDPRGRHMPYAVSIASAGALWSTFIAF